jgi:glucosamine--fructose-6-phosphate aminotransferase (isomerizing)
VKAERTAMDREALEAPDAVANLITANTDACRELADRMRKSPPPFVATCARGSSDNAATYAKYLFETRCGVATASHAPSISSIYQSSVAMQGALFLVISQSGRSPDLLASTECAKAAGAYIVVLCNVADAPLVEMADLSLPLHAGPETSVAATKSFITALAGLLQITAHWADDAELRDAVAALPAQLDAAARLDWSHAHDAFSQADDLFVAGRGYSFCIAQEAALKFKETSKIHAEPFSTAEILHGPMELLRKGFPVLVFAQDDQTRPGTDALIQTVSDKGGRVFAAGTGISGEHCLPVVENANPISAPITMIQSFYPFANAISLDRGMNPDKPRHLRKVTETR